MNFKERIDAAIQNPHRCDCEKAVREEREAVVRYLNMFSELSATHYSYSMFKKALENIGRGEHRK